MSCAKAQNDGSLAFVSRCKVGVPGPEVTAGVGLAGCLEPGCHLPKEGGQVLLEAQNY